MQTFERSRAGAPALPRSALPLRARTVETASRSPVSLRRGCTRTQVVAAAPCASTRSSAACSLSRRSRARTTHASGLNHQTQRSASAAICSSQSPRRAWASSCSSTTRIRSTDHAAADAGSRIAGRRLEQVLGRVTMRHRADTVPRVSCRRRARSLRAADLAVRMRSPGPVRGAGADQSHFIHEFRTFSGMTPGEFAASPRVSALDAE